MVCRCENQLGHQDWAGNPLPNLPECCRPRPAIGNGLEAATDLQIPEPYQIPVYDGIISVNIQI